MNTEKDLLEELIRCQHDPGEKEKERFYKHYWGYLMAVALRYVGNKDLASMVVNDSFLKIFKNLNSFQCEDQTNYHKAIKGWMAKITVRTALNELRRHDRNNSYMELSDTNVGKMHLTMPDRIHEENVWKMINSLSSNLKQVFQLYEIEGFSHEEIGELLGISTSSSRVYLTRAREKLKSLYMTLMA